MCNSFLAAAGLAEADWAFSFLLFQGMTLVTLMLAAIGIFRRNPLATVSAIYLVLFAVVLYAPWAAFSRADTDDPDVVMWGERFATTSALWFGSAVATIAAAITQLILWARGRSGSDATPGR